MRGGAASILVLGLATPLFWMPSPVIGQPVAEGAGTSRADVPLATVNVGVEGRVTYRVPFERNRPVALRASKSDRLSGATVWTAGVASEANATVYDVRFIPNIPGEFDLAGLMERIDGGSIATLPALPVHVWGVLPEEHNGLLVELARPEPPRLGGYRLALVVTGLIWVAVPVVWGIKRLRRARPTLPKPSVPPPTLADQLRPLVDLILDGRGDLAAKARLEMLLLSFWRDRLGLHGMDHAQAVGVLHADREAGALLRAVERWLHARRSGEDVAPTPDAVAELLAPYGEPRTMARFTSPDAPPLPAMSGGGA